MYHLWHSARVVPWQRDQRPPLAIEQLDEMLENAGSALLLYGPDGTIEHGSVAAAHFAGGDTAVWHGFVDAVHAADRDQVAVLFRQAFHGQVVRQVTFRLHDQAGVAQWVRGSWGPREPHRGSAGVWVLLQEISADVRTQHDLHQLQQIVWHNDRLRSLGRLSAEMAHELNNPLTAIQLRAEIMLDGPLPETVRDEVGALLDDMRYASRLVQHILGLARQRETQLELVDVNNIVAQIVAVRNTPLKIQQITLDLRLASGQPLIRADTIQLQQVLLNLLANAQQALLDPQWRTSAARPLQIVIATCIQIDPLLRGEFVMLRVQDNGPGISEAIMDRIMEPFFTTKREGQGTGLGLSIVQDIVHTHGGRVEIASVEGQGTSVEVILPLASAQATQLTFIAEHTRNPKADAGLRLATRNYGDSAWRST